MRREELYLTDMILPRYLLRVSGLRFRESGWRR